MLGASENELALVALLLGLVLLATKIGQIGELVGGLFAGREPPSEPPQRPSSKRAGGDPPA